MKEKNNSNLIMRSLKYLHLILIVAVFYAFWLLFRYGTLFDINRYGFRYNYFVTALFAILFYLFARTYNAYMIGEIRVRRIIMYLSLAEFLAIGALYVAISVAWNRWANPLFLAIAFLAFVSINVIWSNTANYIYFMIYPQEKVAVVFKDRKNRERLFNLDEYPLNLKYIIDKEIENPSSISELEREISEYKTVFVSGIDVELRNELAEYCTNNSVRLMFIPHIGDLIISGAYHMPSFSAPVMYVSRKCPKPEYLFVKRTFDILASIIAIIVFSPIMVVVAIAVKSHDGGPIIYRQTRLTKDGELFEILKFRSMKQDAESDGVARLASENDDRVTPVGKIIRAVRFDELPQLFNILKGDMSIVGPRPERPEIANQYTRDIPEFPLRLQIKAGLTGYAQVYGRYNTEPYEKLEFDLLYMNNMSIITDLQLIFATVGLLFKSESAKGVDSSFSFDNR